MGGGAWEGGGTDRLLGESILHWWTRMTGSKSGSTVLFQVHLLVQAGVTSQFLRGEIGFRSISKKNFGQRRGFFRMVSCANRFGTGRSLLNFFLAGGT